MRGGFALEQGLTKQERCVTRLLAEYALPFSEILTLQSEQDFIYLSDTETYELYLISAPENSRLYDLWGNYRGKRCYEVLQGRSEPCPFCTNRSLSFDRYYVWRYFNPLQQREYILKDRLVQWQGKTVRMEVVMDVSDPGRSDRELIGTLRAQDVLSGCVKPLVNEESLTAALRRILNEIAPLYGAKAGAIQCFTGRGESVQWSAAGQPARGLPAGPSPAAVRRWEEILTGTTQTVLQDAQALRQTDPEAYELCAAHGIDNLCVTPIHLDGRLGGVIMLSGLNEHWGDLSLLNTLAGYISAQLRREELRMENQRIQYLDGLLGCLNFTGFGAETERLRAQDPLRRYSLWYCDIKQFKYLNDALGFRLGDALLQEWGGFMERTLREGETFCRVSADNLSALYRYEGEDELQARFDGMAAHLGAFRPAAARGVRIELAAGVYLLEPDDTLSLNEMLDRANMAQKQVKKQPGSRVCVYSEAMRQQARAELRLESEMQDALQKGEFKVYLQPQLRLNPGADGGPARAEALVRWYRKDRLYAKPGEFIHLFERNGTIAALDRYMLEQVCRMLRTLRDQAAPPLVVAVNVSRVTMLQTDFVETYRRIKDRYGVPDGCIELEFTEDIVVADLKRFGGVVTALQRGGFLCALDDFGTGQSTLSALRSLPMDVLKLDCAFFTDDAYTARGKTIVSSVLEMARRLGMCTVAEGVQTAEQIDALRRWGCDYLQGFICGQPMAAREFCRRLQSETAWTLGGG